MSRLRKGRSNRFRQTKSEITPIMVLVYRRRRSEDWASGHYGRVTEEAGAESGAASVACAPESPGPGQPSGESVPANKGSARRGSAISGDASGGARRARASG